MHNNNLSDKQNNILSDKVTIPQSDNTETAGKLNFPASESTLRKKSNRLSTFEIVLLGFLGALAYVLQATLAFLPNIEIVSLLFLIYTKIFGKKALFSIYVFVLLEGLLYGFGSWWFMYLYVWTVLFIFVMIFRKNDSPVIWAIINGVFGLLFGTLCSILWTLMYGIGSGVAYFISGIPFDIIHCISNFFITLILYKPLSTLLFSAKLNK